MPSTTSDRFSSDDPWAVAITLIPASARAEKTRAAMPGVSAMPSPTTTSVARPVRASTPSISCRAISRWNVSSRLRRARCALSSGTLKQIECSDEACVMSDTEIPSWCTAANVRAAMPGTPSIPLPVTVSSACFGMAESALTGYCSSVRRREISVPSDAGSANGRMRIATFCLSTGTSDRGCSTLAP